MRILLNNYWFLFAYTFGAYTYLAYFVQRTDEWLLLGLFGFLFALYLVQARLVKIPKFKVPSIKFGQILWIAILLRLLLLFAMPKWSDDYYRFVWDGNLVLQGQNPYELTPSAFDFETLDDWNYLSNTVYSGTGKAFPEGMNSKDYYSVYPPVNQMIFAISSAFSRENIWLNIVFLRLFIILFEIGVIIFLGRLLVWFKKDKSLVVLYAFNPLVIMELTGNLHFEGVTLFFVLVSTWLLLRKKDIAAGIIYALAIGTKLIPILFLPLLIGKINWKRLLLFYSVVAIVMILLFIPFLGVNLLETFGQSVQLYFKTFEFNASLYYVLREIGFWLTGYNQIGVIGEVLPFFVLIGVGILTFIHRKEEHLKYLFKPLVWTLLLYYGMASIVHPWYIIYLIGFAVLTDLKFPIAWSFLVMFSYWSYRTNGKVEEEMLPVLLEYCLLIPFILIDLIPSVRKKVNHLFAQG